MDPSPPDPNPFIALQTSLKSALLTTTRATNALLSEDLSFHRSLDPSLARALDKQNARLLELAGRLLGNVEAGAEAVSDAAPRATTASKLLVDGEALEVNWKGVVDVVDSLLERADVSLDEHTGLLKKGAQEVCLLPQLRRGFTRGGRFADFEV
jgi:exosome complex exonuclease RRP6